jgi:hypothetical protein
MLATYYIKPILRRKVIARMPSTKTALCIQKKLNSIIYFVIFLSLTGFSTSTKCYLSERIKHLSATEKIVTLQIDEVLKSFTLFRHILFQKICDPKDNEMFAHAKLVNFIKSSD